AVLATSVPVPLTMSVATPLLAASAANLTDQPPLPAWRAAGLRYHSYRFFLRQKFGQQRVQKVSLDAGFTCPNVDGTVATGGRNFSDNPTVRPTRRKRSL